MTLHNFGPLRNSVNTPTPTSSDVDLESLTCVIDDNTLLDPCLHLLTILREKSYQEKMVYCDGTLD